MKNTYLNLIFILIITLSLFLCSCNSDNTSSVTSSREPVIIIMDGNDNDKINFNDLIKSSDNILYAKCVGFENIYENPSVDTEKEKLPEYALYKFKPVKNIKNNITNDIFMYIRTFIGILEIR